MLRFLLLRFLPRRLVPLLAVVEIVQLIRRFRKRTEPPISPPPGDQAGATETGTGTQRGPRGSWRDRTG